MAFAQTHGPTSRKPLRLWPGVVAVILQWLLWFVAPVVAPNLGIFPMIGAVAATLAVLLWWLFFSRTPWSERIGAIALMIVAVLATRRVVDPSISNGMMGMMLYIYSIPVLTLALVVWAAATRGLSDGLRRASLVPAILLACGTFTLIRTGGISGDGDSDLHWRWTASPEQRLLARADDVPIVAPPALAAVESPRETLKPEAKPSEAPTGEEAAVLPPTPNAAKNDPEWPGFRGPNRDSIVRGVWINSDWSKSPPVQLWRRPIGPGWSSFAVDGDLLYTQEQRGDEEIVAAYNVTTGEPVWRHRDPVRFWESNGGAGPRATPTLSGGRVYTFGATGLLNALDARNGEVVWSRNVALDTRKPVPGWGFASSPWVIDDVVIVAATGTLAGYDIATGKPRWFGPAHPGGYSSPHRVTIDGVEQILLLTADGIISVAPADGKLLWEHAWPGVPIVQPALTPEGDVLISTGDMMGGIGTRRIAVAHQSGGWKVEERWTSNGLKPYFNDFVAHKGYAFGFDGSILACIDLQDGTRKWKGGRYGHGQFVLLADQDLLLVLSEEGELALVAATPDQFREIARVPAIEGKTWNHPVLVGDVLLVRNGEEMAAFRLSGADR